jgi:uncharacterized protein (TIGR02246 family)
MKSVAMVLVAVFITACTQGPQTDLAGLKSMRDVWQSAFEARDANAIAAIYADDAALLPPNSETASGRTAIDAYWTAFLASGVSGEIRDKEVYALGDVGYKIGTYTLNNTDGLTIDEGKYVEIWRHADGKWRLYRDIFNSSLPPPKQKAPNRVVVTAQVADAPKWEEGFRTHGDLLRSMSQTVTYFSASADNRIALYSEPADLDQYLQIMGSPDTAAAMAFDGVDRDTVKIYVLDREFSY